MPSEAEREAGRIKGVAFREFVAWCSAELGHERLVAKVVATAPEVRAQLDLDLHRESLGILSSRWYPAAAIHRLLEAIFADVEPREQARLLDRAAEAVMQATLRGVYRVLFTWLATPQRYALFADRLWRSYYDQGEMSVVLETPGRAVCTIRGWHSHHPLVCALNRSAATAIYRAMGCADALTDRTSCVHEGDAECRFVTTWTERNR